MPEEKKCPFCNFHETPERVILEAETHWVVLSVPNLMECHVLVVPKVHVGAPFDLEPGLCWELMQTAMRFEKRMIAVLSTAWGKPVGTDIRINTRPFMVQSEKSVPGHVHFHVQPRTSHDELWRIVQGHEDVLFERYGKGIVPIDQLRRYRHLLAE